MYAFIRKYGNEQVIVIVNRNDKPLSFTHALLQKGNYKNVFTKAVIKQVSVNPMDIVVLSNK